MPLPSIHALSAESASISSSFLYFDTDKISDRCTIVKSSLCKYTYSLLEICTKLQYNDCMEREPVVNADRIRDEMKRMGLKPGKVAELIGVSYETLYKSLNEENRRVSAEMVAKLAMLFGCSMEYLLSLTDNRSPVTLNL